MTAIIALALKPKPEPATSLPQHYNQEGDRAMAKQANDSKSTEWDNGVQVHAHAATEAVAAAAQAQINDDHNDNYDGDKETPTESEMLTDVSSVETETEASHSRGHGPRPIPAQEKRLLKRLAGLASPNAHKDNNTIHKQSQRGRRNSSDQHHQNIMSKHRQRRRNRSAPSSPRGSTDDDKIANAVNNECSVLRMTRFTNKQLKYLADFLFEGDSDSMHYSQDHLTCSKPAVLAIVASCMQRGVTFDQLENVVGKPADWIAAIYHRTVNWLYCRYKPILDMHPTVQVGHQRLEQYCQAMQHRLGIKYDDVWGVIDTVFVPCAEEEEQDELYDEVRDDYGHKYQIITTPDGLILHVWGPEPGSKTAQSIYNTSDMHETLRKVARGTGNRQLRVMADEDEYQQGGELYRVPINTVKSRGFSGQPVTEMFGSAVCEPSDDELEEWSHQEAVVSAVPSSLTVPEGQDNKGAKFFAAVLLANCNLIFNQRLSLQNTGMPTLKEYIEAAK